MSPDRPRNTAGVPPRTPEEGETFLVRPNFPLIGWRCGTSAPDELRSLDRLFVRGPRWAAIAVFGQGPDGYRKMTIQDHYAEVESLALGPGVPSGIHSHFETARNLLVVGWFLYDVVRVAELHAISGLERALRTRFGSDGKGTLRPIFHRAVMAGVSGRPVPTVPACGRISCPGRTR